MVIAIVGFFGGLVSKVYVSLSADFQYLYDTPTLLHDTSTCLGLGMNIEIDRVKGQGSGVV